MKRIVILFALFAAAFSFALSPEAHADVLTGAGCGPFSASTIDPTCVGMITISTSGFSTSGVGVTITNISGEASSDPQFIKNDLAPNALALNALFSASSVTGKGTFSVESLALAPDLSPVYVLAGNITSFALGDNSITMVLEPTYNTFWNPAGSFVTIDLNGNSGNLALGAARRHLHRRSHHYRRYVEL